jgi:ABC-type sugar transport system substrate-binding protein
LSLHKDINGFELIYRYISFGLWYQEEKMRKKGKKVQVLTGILCFIILMGLSGCREEKYAVNGNNTLVLGFAQLGAESSWRIGNTKSITEAAREAGIQLMFTEAEQKQENQIKNIRSFIAYQVDVIAFAPIVETGWENVLLEAKEAGIPVILTDRTIEGFEDLYTCYIGSDFITEGKMAGQFLKKKFAKEKSEVNIVELVGTVGSSPAEERSKGFRQAISDDQRFKIIKSVSGDFMQSKGKEAMSKILQECDDIDVYYSYCPDPIYYEHHLFEYSNSSVRKADT